MSTKRIRKHKTGESGAQLAIPLDGEHGYEATFSAQQDPMLRSLQLADAHASTANELLYAPTLASLDAAREVCRARAKELAKEFVECKKRIQGERILRDGSREVDAYISLTLLYEHHGGRFLLKWRHVHRRLHKKKKQMFSVGRRLDVPAVLTRAQAFLSKEVDKLKPSTDPDEPPRAAQLSDDQIEAFRQAVFAAEAEAAALRSLWEAIKVTHKRFTGYRHFIKPFAIARMNRRTIFAAHRRAA